jgi:hypothetical protein
VPLLPHVIRLHLDIDIDDEEEHDLSDLVPASGRALMALASLTQLRALSVENVAYAKEDLGTLHDVTQLRELRLTLGNATDYDGKIDEKLTALLRQLSHLHTLTIDHTDIDEPSCFTRLVVVGRACPHLRHLSFGSPICLTHALVSAAMLCIFPNLQSLSSWDYLTFDPIPRQVQSYHNNGRQPSVGRRFLVRGAPFSSYLLLTS